ncbi:DUF4331 domain-containing protein [Beggiatoa alba]|nr:DUF4331 domain-containing protein [Beggiatoa alba]
MKFKKVAIVFAVSCASFAMLNTMTAQASSHREAPAITETPKVDSTDFYMFNSYEQGREDYVTILANYVPLQDPQGGPNYFSMDDDALYEIHIDNDGDAIEDISFQFRFKNSLENGVGKTVSVNGETLSIPLKNIGPITVSDSSNLGFNESYTLRVIQGAKRSAKKTFITNPTVGGYSFTKPFDYIGDKTFTDASKYQAYADQYIYEVQMPNCSATAKVFVGQRKESFVVNLGETFDLVNYVPIEGSITQEAENNDLRGKNITTLALEVPKSCLTGEGNGSIGAWTSASLRQGGSLKSRRSVRYKKNKGRAWVQVSRLGMPLVNELVIGLVDKDKFSRSQPKDDAQFAKYVTNPTLPFLLDALFRSPLGITEDIAPSNFPRNDLVTAFLTGFAGVNQLATVTGSEMLRLNTNIAAVTAGNQQTLGVAAGDVAGFPNGRRPGDDVVDVALRVVMGALCHDLPLGAGGAPVNLLLCGVTAAESKAAAPVGSVAFTDGAPISALDFDTHFPYLRTPIAGSPN